MDFQNQAQLLPDCAPDNPNHDFEDENKPKDFSSVQKYLNMPHLRKFQPQQNVFPPVEKELQQSDKISPELKQSMIDLRDRLRNEFTTFEDSKNFEFTFPQSKFPPVQPGTRNLITYEQKNIVEEEDTFRDKLSSEQIEQISQNGQFKVKSNHDYITLPYVWKVNDSILKGRQNIELAWCINLARIHAILNNARLLLTTQVPKEIQKMKKLPMRVFQLFFGKRSMQSSYPTNAERQIAKDFWNEVMSKHYQKSREWGSDLWEYLDTKMKAEDLMTIRKTENVEEEDDDTNATKIYNEKVKEQQKQRNKYNERVNTSNEKKQKMARIGDEFERKWAKGKKKVFQQVSDQYQKQRQSTSQNDNQVSESQQLIKAKQKQSEDQILERLNAKKFESYTMYLEKRLPSLDVPTGVIDAVVTMLTLMQIMRQKQRKLDARLREEKDRIEARIKKAHKIKQYDYRWYQSEVSRLYDPVHKRITEEQLNKLIDLELIKRLSMPQKQVYNLWLQYRAKYPALLQAKRRQLPGLQLPTRTFHSSYFLFPPYKTIKHNQNNQIWYEMVREQRVQIYTDKNFWKLDLYVMRVKSWTINCVVFLVYNCWAGVFGLRCLWGRELFSYDQYINYSTGQIIDQMRKPVLAVFSTVLEGAKKSRQHFQALPDRGLFGKNFSRYFNYAQCYIFRLLFVGVILTLILYPIAIVCLSFLGFVMILTVWAWMPVVLLVTYLFNTIVFQFESGFVPYGFFIRSAPLPSLVLSLLASLFKIIAYAIYASILAPIGASLVSLWACFIRGFHTATDTVMLFLISKLGRTPSRDTAIAKKISGPGMSKQYYMSINEQDVYILIQAQLQQLFMRQYDRMLNQKISEPFDRFAQAMHLLLTPLQGSLFSYLSQPQNVISQSVNDLQNNYSIQYQNYMNRYPTRPYNIRFTQEELDSYFDNTVMIVKNFVSKNQVASWVFDEYHILEDYEELTRKIWMVVFSCGQEIFEPLQKIDQRFKLEDMYKSNNHEQQLDEMSSSFAGPSMKKNVHKVMQALEGQIELKPRRANIANFKHSLMSKEISAAGIRQVFTYMNANANGNVNIDTQNPKYVFYVNLPVLEIIKKDAYEYQWRKEDNRKLLSKRN